MEIDAGAGDDEAPDVVDEAGFLGDRNEHRRRHGAELARRPAHQRFQADDLAIRGADDRLVEHLEVAVFEGAAQAGLDLFLLQRAGFHGRVIGNRLAFGAVLGVIHRNVGAANDLG